MMLPEVIELKISEAEAKQGQRGNCYQCPVALALNRLYPDCHPFISPDFVLMNNQDNERCAYRVDADTSFIIRSFDNGGRSFPANQVTKLTFVCNYGRDIGANWNKEAKS